MAEGYITKRVTATGATRWQARIELGRDDAGKRVTKAGWFDYKRDAMAALQGWRAERDAGTLVAKRLATLGEYLPRWLDGTKRGAVADSTLANYRQWVEKHIVPCMGHLPLQAVAASHIRDFRNDRRASGLSVRSVNYMLGILRDALHAATEEHLIGTNPAAGVERLVDRAVHDDALTADQVATLASAIAADSLRALWTLAVTSGMRRAELAGLRWADLDLDRATVRVRRSRSLVAGVPEDAVTKSRAGQRLIRLDGDTCQALIAHGARQAEIAASMPDWQQTGHVFTTRRGTPYHPDALSHRFQRLAAGAGVPAHLHSMRHLCASLALDGGASLTQISRQLGHSRPSTTTDIYGRLLHTGDAGVAETVARGLRKG